ncbi:2Fe-2S iron-sulfur cluster-binding protein [Nannocystaceae bacterium ST9]
MSRLAKLVPRSLQPRIDQLRRDVRTLVADLRGERAPTWIGRSGARYPTSAALATRECEVVELVRETADAISLVLRDASGAEWPRVRPGQFFTVLVPLPGEPALRRAYSASGDCRDRSRVRLTIKRVAEGRASNWLIEHAELGMRLRVLGPSGEFGVEPDPEAAPRKLIMIAGGSGITPMMAILHTLPELEPRAELALIDGNRSAPDIVFAAELAALAARHADRLTIVHALEQPPEGWTGHVGRLDEPTLQAILAELALADDPECEFMICGPAGMMEAARAALHQRGIDDERIHREDFFQPHLRSDARVQVRDPQPVTLVIDGREIGVVVQPGQTLLEAGLAAGLAMPYSCAMGGCAACKVQLERGEVVMQEPNCLGASERAAGFVLACIGSPTRACRVRVPGV